MIELYEAKGMSREDATEVITRLARYREIFLEAMMKDELDLPMPDEADHANSVRSALTMFASFAVFGMVHRPQTPNPTQRTDDADTDRHRSPTHETPTVTSTPIPTLLPNPNPNPNPIPNPTPTLTLTRCPSSASPSCRSYGGTARTRNSSWSPAASPS